MTGKSRHIAEVAHLKVSNKNIPGGERGGKSLVS
jgi:hypothetical protein